MAPSRTDTKVDNETVSTRKKTFPYDDEETENNASVSKPKRMCPCDEEETEKNASVSKRKRMSSCDKEETESNASASKRKRMSPCDMEETELNNGTVSSRKRAHPYDKNDCAHFSKKAVQENASQAGSSEMDPVTDSSPLYTASDDDLIEIVHYMPAGDYVSDHLDSDESVCTPQYDDEFNFFPNSNGKTRNNNRNKYNLRKRKCPLPVLSWASCRDVWYKMCMGDVEVNLWTSHNLFERHPGLQMRMRAILLDWIIEVCEVYKLYRETFHLTVNYIDRYLSSAEEVHKGRLQLIGITCLFIAAKVEEIYPPKINEFAYVTDGACTKEDILAEEMIILQTLNWRTTPNTINRWLNTYMQLIALQSHHPDTPMIEESPGNEIKKYTFIFPQYSSLQYVICGQLIDLAVLHVDVNAFPYSLIAAAAIAHLHGKDVATSVSGYELEELEPCFEWLLPFALVLKNDGDGLSSVGKTLPDSGDYTANGGGITKICPNVNVDQSHTLQVHNINLEQFDKVQEYMEMNRIKHIESTPTSSSNSCILAQPPITPPYSDEKYEGQQLETKTPIQSGGDK